MNEGGDRWFGEARPALVKGRDVSLIAVPSPQLNKIEIFTPALSVFLNTTKVSERLLFLNNYFRRTQRSNPVMMILM